MQRREHGIEDLIGDALRREEVHLRVAASAPQIYLVRLVAEGIAAHADFDLDAIADIKMAVDEVATSLVEQAVPGTQLDCDVRCLGGEITVSMSARTPDGNVPSTRTFGWHILSTLTTTLSATTEIGQVVRVEFTKRISA